jgi:hypothetical protein
MNTSRTYSAVKEQVKAKFSWKYAGGALGVVVVVLLLSLVQPWSTTAYELSDSGVWVSKGADLGRVNTQVAQMDYVGDVDGPQIQQGNEENGPTLVQGGRSVFLVTDGGESIVAPQPQQPMAEPKRLDISGVKELALGGGTGNDQVVVARTESEVFLVGRGGTLLQEPGAALMKVGPKSQVAVGSGGTVVAYSPQAGKKEATLQYRELGSEDVRKETLSTEPGEDTTLTMIGEQVVLLDAEAQQLLLPGSDPISLDGLTSPKVQLPGPQADSVVVADEKELISVNLKSGKPKTISSDGDGGTPVRPAVDANCVHGAWGSVVVARCGGGTVLKEPLESGQWAFRPGGVTALLTNTMTGNSWMVFDQNQLQEVPWPESQETKNPDPLVQETPPNRDPNIKPTAKCEGVVEGEPSLGARINKVTYLNVLANDTDPNRDPILVSGEVKPATDGPKFSIAQGGRSIQIDTRTATVENQTYEFEYQVSDGQLDSDPARCKVRIVPANENTPPAPLKNADLAFEAVPNKQVNYDLLAHFFDPDGDPIILSEAREEPASGDKVSFDPTGFIYFTSGGKTSSVTASVQDVPPNAQSRPVDWPVQARVAVEKKPPTARNDVVEVVVNETKTVQPLLNDSDPNGDELNLEDGKIEEVRDGKKAALVISPSDDPKKSFELTASEPGFYTLSYEVTDDNTDPVEGRITVKASPPAESSLVALNDVVIVSVGSTATVDLLANDSDAKGGVLSVVDLLSPTPAPDPCSTKQLSGSVLNDFTTFQVVALDAAIPAVCQFTYEVTNGPKNVRADVVVIINPATNNRPEFIHPEPFTVRARQVGVIPLGAFAQDADGDPITVLLDPDPKFQLPASGDSGQIYQSGNDLKYVAPQDPPAGPVEVHVLISDQDTSKTQIPGTVKIQVNQPSNMPPKPKDVTVRVRAGQDISIPVPLVGLDGDWTALELTRWEPVDGVVVGIEVDRGSQTLRFKAPSPSEVPSGATTKFRYFVRYADGGEGSALVTVHIIPQKENHPPSAVPDIVVAQIGSPIWIEPASNDTDLDGDLLKVVGSNSKSPDCQAEPDGDRIKITARSNCTIDYSVSDYNPTDTKFADPKSPPVDGIISVRVEDNYLGLRPIARDDYAEIPIGSDGKFATVNVLANDEDPDGVASALKIDFGEYQKSISKEDSPGKVKIELTEDTQRLQYSITDAQDLEAVAFVWVPPQAANRPPVAKPDNPVISAKVGGGAVEIKLSNYIIDPDTGFGTDLTFSDVQSEQASNSAQMGNRIQEGIVIFDPRDVPGLGRIRVTATERSGEKLSSTIVLAVEIQPAENVLPRWTQPNPCNVQVEQDSADSPEKFQKVGLAAFAQDPDDLSKAGLRFNGVPKLENEVTATVSEAGEFIAKASGAAEGEGGTVEVTLTDGAGGIADSSVKCTIRVIPSTKPDVRVKSVDLETTQGQSLTVEIASVLEEPGKGATFLSATIPADAGSAQPSGTRLTYTPGKDFTGKANIAFTVEEKRTTNNKPRSATGNIAVTVKGPPKGLIAPRADGGTLSDAKIVLTYGAADQNFDPSPIRYSVRSASGLVTKDCGTALTCTVDAGNGVKNNQDYAFILIAENSSGKSESPASTPVQTDVKPRPPTDVRRTEEGDTRLTFAFGEPEKSANGMSPIIGYDCILSNGQTTRVGPSPQICSFSGLANGTDYTLRVKTITGKSESELSALVPTATGNPFGAPIINSPTLAWTSSAGGMTLTASADVTDNGRAANSTWTISCSGQSGGSSNPATFTCDRTAGNIVATITATNERGPTVATDDYKFPAEPTAEILDVISRFNSVEVVADYRGEGTNLRLEYFSDLSDLPQPGKILNPFPDDYAPVYVRACSDEWPECGEVVEDEGAAYGQALEPTCENEGPGEDPAESFTCVLNWDTNGLFVPEYISKDLDTDGNITVLCEQTATVYAQYEGDPLSNSDPLQVDGPICPPPTTEPVVPG